MPSKRYLLLGEGKLNSLLFIVAVIQNTIKKKTLKGHLPNCGEK